MFELYDDEEEFGDSDENELYPDAPYQGPALHTYEPDENGRCKSGWYSRDGRWITCGSTQRDSVLHDDPEAEFRQMHDHGGGDCMCFESEGGPSFYEAMEAYVKDRRG